MTDTAGPDRVASAEQIGLSAREAAATPEPEGARTAPRDTGSWAKKVDRLEVDPRAGVRGTNVAGRRLTGPVQGFGKMWQKTYRMNAGPAIAPEAAIATWKQHFPEFWPKGNRFSGALTGINPGDVALLDLAIGGGVKLSTGVFVLYADTESFTLMTPQGHMFAGWITFSAEREGDETIVQALVLMRANDPIYEIGMTLGGHAKEDKFWAATLTALGQRLGLPEPKVDTRSTCVDSKRQWRHARNIWHNSAVRSVLQTIAAPVTGLARMLRNDKPGAKTAA
ncbi:MAG: fungal specific transcription factor domain-containing protein [Streptosporangiaceae bacterium]